jgi:hypothetical protein
MGLRLQQRRLKDVQRQLAASRESVRVLEEQVRVWRDALDDVRIRSLVSETPLQAQEFEELSRHVQVAVAELERRKVDVQVLTENRDQLLREWNPKESNG